MTSRTTVSSLLFAIALVGCGESSSTEPILTTPVVSAVPEPLTPAAEVVPSVRFVTPMNGAVVESSTLEVTVAVINGDAAGLGWSLANTLLTEQSGPFAVGTERTLSVGLVPGPNVVSVEALAPSGASDIRELVVVLDAPAAPVLSLGSPGPEDEVETSTIDVRGEVFARDEPVRAQLFVDGDARDLVLEQNGDAWGFSVDVELPYGATLLRIELEDAAGQVTSVERTLTRVVDEVPPVFSDVWPTDGHGLVSTSPTVWGRVDDNDAVDTVELEQHGIRTPAVLLADGRFRAYLELERGAGAFAVIATDLSGNEVRTDRTVWLGNRVAAGGSHSGWVQSDGSLTMWGRNNIGQVGVGYTSALGDTEPVHPHVPTTIAVGSSLVSIAAFQNSSVALDTTGALWGWGENGDGQLGLGTPAVDDDFVDADQSNPMPSTGTADVVSIASGYYHLLALQSDGTVMAMGRNGDGQLGDGSSDDRDHLVAVGSLTDVIQVAAASSTSFALTTTGSLYAWGANDYGQLGNGTEDDAPHSTPELVPGLPTIAMVAAGRDHVLVVDEDGGVWGWGLNASTQVGGPSNGLVDSPVLTPTALPHLGEAVAVYSNGNQSYLETSAGLLYGWGQNGVAGALGVPATGDLPAPIGPVFGLTDVAEAGVGALHSIGLRSDGQAFAWGWSFQGSLGAGDGVINAWGYRIPIQVTAPAAP